MLICCGPLIEFSLKACIDERSCPSYSVISTPSRVEGSFELVANIATIEEKIKIIIKLITKHFIKILTLGNLKELKIRLFFNACTSKVLNNKKVGGLFSYFFYHIDLPGSTGQSTSPSGFSSIET